MRGTLTSLLVALAATGASAQETKSIFDCRAIGADAERLACYDALVDRVQRATARPSLPAPAAEPAEALPPPTPTVAANTAPATPEAQKQTLRERIFGSEAKSRDVIEEVFGVDQSGDQTEQVASVNRNGYGKLVVTLANGQTWTQLDSLPLQVSAGDEVRIRSAVLGSFQLEKAGGSRRIRVRRTD